MKELQEAREEFIFREGLMRHPYATRCRNEAYVRWLYCVRALNAGLCVTCHRKEHRKYV